MSPSSQNLRPNQAAEYLGFAASTLAKMRLPGDGPDFIKAGKRIVIYRRSDLDDWLAAGRRTSTSDVPVFDSRLDAHRTTGPV